jgi:hypothetical protein
LEVTSHNGNRADGGDGRPRGRKEGRRRRSRLDSGSKNGTGGASPLSPMFVVLILIKRKLKKN